MTTGNSDSTMLMAHDVAQLSVPGEGATTMGRVPPGKPGRRGEAAKPQKPRTSSARSAKPASPSKLRIHALHFQQHDFDLAVFPYPAKQLWEIVEVNQRSDDKEEGYQRALSPKRVTAVRDYLNDTGLLPTAVCVTFEGAEFDFKSSELVVPNVRDAGWVIDGQHRLAGAYLANGDITVPVVAFLNLPLEDQIRAFVTINREQKGVPTSLYFDLLNSLKPLKAKDAAKARAADIAKELTLDEESPFHGKILVNRAPLKGRELSLTLFIRKLEPLLKSPGVLASHAPYFQAKILNNYYKALETLFSEDFHSDDSFFWKTVGFGGLIEALPTLMQQADYRFNGMRVQEFQKLLEPLGDYDFSHWEGQGTGQTREGQVAQSVIEHINRRLGDIDYTNLKHVKI